jgi:hypothetical protein
MPNGRHLTTVPDNDARNRYANWAFPHAAEMCVVYCANQSTNGCWLCDEAQVCGIARCALCGSVGFPEKAHRQLVVSIDFTKPAPALKPLRNLQYG